MERNTLSAPYYDQLRSLHADVSVTHERLNRSLSVLDRQLSAVYHEIEKHGDIDEAYGLGAALLLQSILRKRRVIKDELFRLYPVYNMLKLNMADVETRYSKVAANSVKIRRSLNVTLTIEEVLTNDASTRSTTR
jgi:hypothetical protein